MLFYNLYIIFITFEFQLDSMQHNTYLKHCQMHEWTSSKNYLFHLVLSGMFINSFYSLLFHYFMRVVVFRCAFVFVSARRKEIELKKNTTKAKHKNLEENMKRINAWHQNIGLRWRKRV